MRNFQQKSGFKYFMQSKPALVVLIILVLTFAWNIVGLLSKMNETAKNRKAVEEKITEMEKVRVQLSADISSLNTDKGIEESIREKFGFAKEGEGMIVIVDDKNPAIDETQNEKKGFFSWFKNLFK
jgi:cell division protein FtsB